MLPNADDWGGVTESSRWRLLWQGDHRFLRTSSTRFSVRRPSGWSACAVI